jgi:hypothetical protein
MARGNVRSHARRTKSGGTTTVRQHSRRVRGGRGLVTPGHAWKMARRAFGAARRHKRVTAAVFGGLALGELAAWLTLRGVGLVLVTAGILAIGVACLAAAASGMDLS